MEKEKKRGKKRHFVWYLCGISEWLKLKLLFLTLL